MVPRLVDQLLIAADEALRTLAGVATAARPLPGREEAGGSQALLELLEGELTGAEPLRLQVLARQLIFAFRPVDADAAARDDAQPILGLEPQQPQ